MTCSCYTKESNLCNDEIRPKRIIQSQQKSSYWQVRQKTGAIEAIYQPARPQTPKNHSNVLICAAVPDGVQKTTSKIKYGNKSTSRYHKNCTTNKPNPKRMRNTIRRNITTESCVDCPCAKNKGIKFKNECYCISPPTKPKLPGGPEMTVPASEFEDDNLIRRCDDSSLQYRPETLQMAKDIIDYIPQSTFLSRMYRENCKKCMCNSCILNAANNNMKYTERRLNLENAYHKLAESNRIDFDKLSKLKCVNISELHISPGSSRSSSPINSGYPVSDDDGCVRRSCMSRKISHDQIHAVKAIRKHCYFDTHSTNELSTMSEGTAVCENHKCVFKYTIDERGLLAPLNPDAFGTNRCSICNKAQPDERPQSQSTHKNKREKVTKKKTKKTEGHKSPKKVTTTSSMKPPVRQESSKIIMPVSPKPSKTPKTEKSPKSNKPRGVESPSKIPVSKNPCQLCKPCKHSEVCNPSADKTVQLEISSSTIYDKKKSKTFSPKYLAPVNSWALRYQKGVSA